jgi:PEP-CTERM/exosortase A-associated glycosyltransferase
VKILHVFDHSLPLQDGYSSRSWAILQQQLKRGWAVFPVTGPRQNSERSGEESVSGLTFYRTADRPSLWGRLPVVKQFWTIWQVYQRLCELIPQLKPDLLHAHSPALNGVAAHLASRKFGLPLVYEVRAFWEDAAVDQGTSSENGVRYRMTRALENYVFRRAQRVTAICEGLKQDIEARAVCVAPVTVIPNAVEYERFARATPRDADLAARHGLKAGNTLGFVGSFYDYEGLDLLIEAMPRLLARNPDIRLLLVGGGMQEAALRQQAEHLGLQNEVVFTGRVPYGEVERYYSVVDVLVYPRKSLRLTELVTPLKPLEAMAQRKVFVASDVGGHRELVRDGVTGVLFRADDVASLADAVLGVLGSPDLQSRLRENGLAFVRDERNWRNSVERYVDVYRGALGAGATAAR